MRTIRTAKNRDAVLAALSQGASYTKAAEAAGISRRALFEWKAADPEFEAACLSAEDEGTDRIEDEAHRRAVEGVDEPVFYQGSVAGYVRRYSDTLAIVMLKARRPEKFKERTANEHTGAGGGAIEVKDAAVSDIRALLRELAGAKAGGSGGAPPVDQGG